MSYSYSAVQSESKHCWFVFVLTFPKTNTKKKEAAPKNEAGGDEKHLFCVFTWTY